MIAAAVLLLIQAPAAPPAEARAFFKGVSMGSSLEIEVFGADQALCDRAVQEARAEVDRLDRMMTDWKPESPLMDINRAAGREPVKTTPELFFLIERSRRITDSRPPAIAALASGESATMHRH